MSYYKTNVTVKYREAPDGDVITITVDLPASEVWVNWNSPDATEAAKYEAKAVVARLLGPKLLNALYSDVEVNAYYDHS